MKLISKEMPLIISMFVRIAAKINPWPRFAFVNHDTREQRMVNSYHFRK